MADNLIRLAGVLAPRRYPLPMLSPQIDRPEKPGPGIARKHLKKTAISKPANVPPDAHALPAITTSEALEAHSPSPSPGVCDMG